jgi:adenosylhomocysteine nucleosidase
MTRIGIVAALPGELQPLTRGWCRRNGVFHGRIGQVDAVAACAGMGAASARRACDLVLQSGPLDALASIGWAGSLSCGIKPPEACAVREVIDVNGGEHFTTLTPQGQRLVTLGHVAHAEEKRRLASKYQAALVDMEAAAVAGVARNRGLGFYCFKAITDGPSDQLPDFSRFTGADGQLRMTSFVAHAALHPAMWPALLRLGRNSRGAAMALSNFIDGFFSGSQ